jgi:hypothetical protein
MKNCLLNLRTKSHNPFIIQCRGWESNPHARCQAQDFKVNAPAFRNLLNLLQLAFKPLCEKSFWYKQMQTLPGPGCMFLSLFGGK